MTLLANSNGFNWSTYGVPIAGVIIALVVLVLFRQDVVRFRFGRVRAIAGVCFTEAIRRRVLWITPLAILGVIAVSQLTRPLDAQDAIRQTTKYCLFATGLVTVLTSILLACANLPKEIESRVIFTIVTKPTTRLEIVLGKVLGFTLVSGLILLIMGSFTFIYLQTRAWSFERDIKQVLQAGSVPEGPVRASLQQYADQGLLRTKSVLWPDDVQVYAREASADGTRWSAGSSQSFFVVPFVLSDAQKKSITDAVNAGGGPVFSINLKIERRANLAATERDELATDAHPTESTATFGPSMPTTQPTLPIPRISVIARAHKDGAVVAPTEFSGEKSIYATRDRNWASGGMRQFFIPITDTNVLQDILDTARFNLEITGVTPGYDYGVGKSPVSLMVLRLDPNNAGQPTPIVKVDSSETDSVQPEPSQAGGQLRSEPPGTRFYSRFGRLGMQVSGRPPEEGDGPVAVYSFRGAELKPRDGKVTLQTKISIERPGDLDADRYKSSIASVTVRNIKTGAMSDPVQVEPGTNRLIDIEVPVSAVEGGDFDVLIRGRTPGQYLGVHGMTASVPSIAVVEADHWFIINLFKGLLILWLLTGLVVTISVFCSTFLSWPIAVILTVLLLMGRWGVNQLGDSLNPGASRTVVQDLFKTRDATKTQAMTDSLENLSAVLRNLAPFLPDVNRFPVMEDLDRGVSIPLPRLGRSLTELLMYGVPLLLLTYVILRRKEVAP